MQLIYRSNIIYEDKLLSLSAVLTYFANLVFIGFFYWKT